jgi:endogenous inhibitor of DNA gyrase (YacG/DUF329 family)
MAQTVLCPICGKAVDLDDPNMPFCSDRCRVLDLARWATEGYVISTPDGQGELEETSSQVHTEHPKGPIQ